VRRNPMRPALLSSRIASFFRESGDRLERVPDACRPGPAHGDKQPGRILHRSRPSGLGSGTAAAARRRTCGAWVILVVLGVGSSMGADWTRFRGPQAGGRSDQTGVAVRWSPEQNVLWKTAMPGFGTSSPIILGERVFLSCYSGYGLDQEEPGRSKDLKHHLVSVDLKSGKILWQTSNKAELPETEYRGFVALHGYSSSTPTTDGQAVYSFFGRSGVFAYTLSGEQIWQASVGNKTHGWGSGASPILYKNLLIVNASIESGSLVALDKASGKEVWRAGGINQSWGTPLVVDLADGKQELVLSIKGKTLGFDPATGEKLWSCDSVDDYICPAVIAHEGIVYICGGRRPLTCAIRSGGRGDVTDTHRLWTLKKSTKVPTPLYSDGLLYWVDQRGIAVCLKADDGAVVYEKRLKIKGRRDKVYASPVLADGKLYVVTREGGTIVLATGESFEELARNSLGDESIFNATPAITGSQLLIRSDRFLYCIGK